MTSTSPKERPALCQILIGDSNFPVFPLSSQPNSPYDRPMMMSKRERLAWALLLAIALLSRLAGLGHRAMSHDESLHAVYSRYLVEGFGYHHDPMMHGPLLFHLNALVDLILPHNDFTYRLVPALMGVGCVAFLILYRRWLGPRTALTAALLLTFEPAHLYYSRYLRNDIYMSLFTLWMFWAVLRYREERRPGHLIHLALALALSFACKEVCYIHGAVFGSACLLFAALDALRSPQKPWEVLYRHPFTQCAVLMLTLALPFASALLAPNLEWDQRSAPDPETFRTILGLSLLPFGVGTAMAIPFFHSLGRLKTWGTCFMLFWSVQLTLYTTLFHYPAQGFATGVWGGLGYWLAQHEVERGNARVTFYLSLLLLYAPVLLTGLIHGVRKWNTPWVGFALYWAVGHVLIYSWAGERMPWLVMHLTLPLSLLTAAAADSLFTCRGWTRRLTMLIMGLGMLQLTVNGLRAIGPNAEGPIEPLIYAHSGAQVKPAVELAFRHLQENPDTLLVSENEFSWPMLWYFRHGPGLFQYQETLDSLPAHTSVIFTSPSNRDRFLRAGWTARMEVAMTTWPRPHYHELSLNNFRNLVTRPAVRRKLFRYYLDRSQPDWGPYEYPGPHRFLMMTRIPTEDPPLP